NYRNVSGYVELEFTEPVLGFWGMRFPTDRIGAQATAPQPAPTSVPAMPKLDAAANFTALKALVSSSSAPEIPAASSVTVKANAPAAEPAPKAAQPVPAPTKVAPASTDPSTEALKLEAARLQQQLSTVLFTEKVQNSAQPQSMTAPAPAHDAATKILEFVKP